MSASALTEVAHASPGGNLAFDKELVYVEKGKETVTCPNWPFFDLKVNITDVTNLNGIVFSVHWDPTILNCTMENLRDPGFIPGDFLPTGPPDATGWFIYYWDFAAGNMSEAANSIVAGKTLKNVTRPAWGWVATLRFKLIGTPPAIGFPVETNILIMNQPLADMRSVWQESWKFWHDFNNLSPPYVHKCHFYYEAVQTLPHMVTVDTETFYVVTESNSEVKNFAFNETYAADGWRGEISFDVTGLAGTSGFCKVTIPKNLMKGEPSFLILIDGVETSYSPSENATHTSLYFTYTQGSHKVQIYGTWVVPEFSAHTFLMTLIVVALVIAVLAKIVWSNKQRRL